MYNNIGFPASFYSNDYHFTGELKTTSTKTQRILRPMDGLFESGKSSAQLSLTLTDKADENISQHDFVASVAHEMNNPLQTTASFLEFLIQGRVGQLNIEQQDYLLAASAGIKQVQVLLQDLLCDSQISRLQFEIDLKPIDLRKVIRGVFNQFSLISPTFGVCLVGENLEGEPLMVLGAENRLQQVLINFLNNAFKFSPAGGEIKVVLRQDGDDYKVEVIDKGPGISAENQERVFERHFQVKNSSGRHHTGYGLGLNIARDLIELQGGEIGVDSEPGQGSNFWFSLPVIKRNHLEPVDCTCLNCIGLEPIVN